MDRISIKVSSLYDIFTVQVPLLVAWVTADLTAVSIQLMVSVV